MKGSSVPQISKLKEEINGLLRKEEKMWKQRSRALWLHEGDSNTRYFHSRATHRYRRNKIDSLENAARKLSIDEKEIASILVAYYQNLFDSSHPMHIEEVLVATPSLVIEEMNEKLIATFLRSEVDIALKQIEPLKAPRPDGMPPLFYQQFWPTIGEEVSDVVLECLNSGSISPSLNLTFITLIPKVKSPTKVSKYHPIALCNILYKLISKVLANRLKKILPNLISESQSAFQPSKAISDNILVAFKTLHHMKNQKSKKAGFMVMKLNMSKAYNRAEWSFLVKIMEKMGFCDKWLSLIFECISTVSYLILVNGEPTGDIKPSRGIRQGDPLSLYLFLLCLEGLNRLLQRAASEDSIRGFSLCKSGPKVSHLFFADDSLLFCRANMAELTTIHNILALYEQASSQQLKREKTTLFFNKAVSEDTKSRITSFLGVLEVKEYEKYLGFLAVVGRNKKASLIYIKERVWSKLQGWKEKLLSQAGREILLKAVVQVIPTFTMSCFKLPVGLCNEIESLIRKFFWGQKGEQRKIHWKKWETLCKPKTKGGLGFKDLVKFNEVLLAKQVWRLLHDHNSLFFRVFKAKYFPTRSVFYAKSFVGSYVWHSILKARKVVAAGMLWKVGSGESIRIYDENWLLGGASPRILSPQVNELENSTVACLIDPTSRGRNNLLIDQYFLPFEAQRIKAIPLCASTQEDCLTWSRTRGREYSVKTGYQLLCEEDNAVVASSSDVTTRRKFWSQIWKLKVPHKVRTFLWKACFDVLPTLQNLKIN